MTRAAAAAAILLGLLQPLCARAADADSPPAPGVVSHTVKTKVGRYEQLTLFLRPAAGGKAKGVLCLCLLGKDPEAIRAQVAGTSGSQAADQALAYAAPRGLAVVAWGARQLWNPSRNWDELPRGEKDRIEDDFRHIAQAWDAGIKYFVDNHGLPASGYLVMGSSAAAQFAQRLALCRPARFLAVHAHIASSFDAPDRRAASILWCVTTGENELGYARSLRFFRAARANDFPIVYKAFPGLGHAGNAKVTALGFACFDYALAEYARAARRPGGKGAMPDWRRLFAAAPWVADVFNQTVHPRADVDCVPEEFRMSLPDPLRAAWSAE